MRNSTWSVVILLLVFLIPFRYAFFMENVEGMWNMFNFLLVIMGVVAALFFALRPEKQ